MSLVFKVKPLDPTTISDHTSVEFLVSLDYNLKTYLKWSLLNNKYFIEQMEQEMIEFFCRKTESVTSPSLVWDIVKTSFQGCILAHASYKKSNTYLNLNPRGRMLKNC